MDMKIDLRDWLAGTVNIETPYSRVGEGYDFEVAAVLRYEYADAMIAASGRRKSTHDNLVIAARWALGMLQIMDPPNPGTRNSYQSGVRTLRDALREVTR